MARRNNATRYGQALGNVGAANLNTQLQIEQLKRDREDARAAAVNQALGQITGGLVGGLGAAGNIAGNIQQGNIQRQQLEMQKAADARAAETARLQQQQMSNQIRREAEAEAAQSATFDMSRFAPQAAEAESAEMVRQRDNQSAAEAAGGRIGSRVPYSPDKGFYTPEEAKQAMQIVGEETSDLDVGPEAPEGYRAKQELERLKGETKANIREVLQRNGVQNPTDAQIDSLYARGEAGFREMEQKQYESRIKNDLTEAQVAVARAKANPGATVKKTLTPGVSDRLNGAHDVLRRFKRVGDSAKALQKNDWEKISALRSLELASGLPPTASISEGISQSRGVSAMAGVPVINIGAGGGREASRNVSYSVGGYNIGERQAVELQKAIDQLSPEARAFLSDMAITNRQMARSIEKGILTTPDAQFYSQHLPNAMTGPETFGKVYNNLMSDATAGYKNQYDGFNYAFDLPPEWKQEHTRWFTGDGVVQEGVYLKIDPVDVKQKSVPVVDPRIPGFPYKSPGGDLLKSGEGEIIPSGDENTANPLPDPDVKPPPKGSPYVLHKLVPEERLQIEERIKQLDEALANPNLTPEDRDIFLTEKKQLSATDLTNTRPEPPRIQRTMGAKAGVSADGAKNRFSPSDRPELERRQAPPTPKPKKVDPRIQAAFQAVMGANKEDLYNMAASTDEAGFDMPEPEQLPQQMRQGPNSGIPELDAILANITNVDAMSGVPYKDPVQGALAQTAQAIGLPPPADDSQTSPFDSRKDPRQEAATNITNDLLKDADKVIGDELKDKYKRKSLTEDPNRFNAGGPRDETPSPKPPPKQRPQKFVVTQEAIDEAAIELARVKGPYKRTAATDAEIAKALEATNGDRAAAIRMIRGR
jgi:hypothetical protein